MKKSSNLTKYQSKNPFKKFLIRLFIEKIINKISSLKINTVLDAGCGEGLIMEKISQRLPEVKIDGFDISKLCLELAKKNLPNNNFFVCDIHKTPFIENSYDLVIALEVLEHLENPQRALAELKRVTKNYCLISVPWEPYFSLANFLNGKNLRRFGKDIEHLNFWSKREIKELVNRYFKVIALEVSFPWIIILARKEKPKDF